MTDTREHAVATHFQRSLAVMEQAARDPALRPTMPAIRLTTDTSVLSAVGNDYGYEKVFERQIRGLGRAGDILIGISTSGRSPNVLAALEAARKLGMTTVAFTGTAHGANAMRAHSDIVLAA